MALDTPLSGQQAVSEEAKIKNKNKKIPAKCV